MHGAAMRFSAFCQRFFAKAPVRTPTQCINARPNTRLSARLLGLGLAVASACALSPVAFAGAGGEPTSPGISWIVMDANTGRILGQNQAYTLRYPASLTKLMTLDLAFAALRAHRLSFATDLPVSRAASHVQPVKLDLVPGQTVTVRQAVLGMTTLSANDAATALGQYLGGGSISRFAGMMTARAHQLGMLRTQFANPSGLPNPTQVTDAYDMAILARHLLLDYPQYRYLFSVPHFTFEGRVIPNIDGMLKRYPGAIGMKTGYTNLARFNLVTAAVRNGHLLIGVELHAHSWRVAYSTMAQLLDQGFAAEGAGSPPLTLAANQPSAAPVITRVASRTVHPMAPVLRVADVAKLRARPVRGGQWIAQVGSYDNYPAARRQALAVHHLRGNQGRVLILPALVRGRRMWRAQLAGLDRVAAKQTCSLLARRHLSCFVIAPARESLAMR